MHTQRMEDRIDDAVNLKLYRNSHKIPVHGGRIKAPQGCGIKSVLQKTLQKCSFTNVHSHSELKASESDYFLTKYIAFSLDYIHVYIQSNGRRFVQFPSANIYIYKSY